MMHLTQSKQSSFSYCVTALWDYEVSCKSAGVDEVMMGNVCGKTALQSTCILIMASCVCVVLVLTHDFHDVCMNYSEIGVIRCDTVHSMFPCQCRNCSIVFPKLYCSCCTCTAICVDVWDISVSKRITFNLWL